jgi:hypothetical protein
VRVSIGRRGQAAIFGALTLVLTALTVLNAVLGDTALAMLAGVIAANCALRAIGAMRGRRFGLTFGRRRAARPRRPDPTTATARRERARRMLQNPEAAPDARARERREARRRRRLGD